MRKNECTCKPDSKLKAMGREDREFILKTQANGGTPGFFSGVNFAGLQTLTDLKPFLDHCERLGIGKGGIISESDAGIIELPPQIEAEYSILKDKSCRLHQINRAAFVGGFLTGILWKRRGDFAK